MNEIEKGQLAQETVQCFTNADGSLSNFPGLLKLIITERAWERRIHHGRTIELANLRELITRAPIDGWGQDPKKIEAVIRDDAEALAMFREAMKATNQHDLHGNNITMHSKGQRVTGTGRAYTLSRLKRQAPELYRAVCDGEMSANAAAIKAGFRKVKSPVDLFKTAWQKMGAKQREEMIAWILKQ